MKLTKSQKIYLSLLGVGVCALAWDRNFGTPARTGPASAMGTSMPAMDAEGPGNEVRAAQAVVGATEGSVATRLLALRPAGGGPIEVRDAFSPSTAWIAGGEAHGGAPGHRALNFQTAHRLKAIVESRNGGQAWVDNNLVSVGQSIDGFTLISVGRMGAEFTDGALRVELRLESAETETQQPLQSR